MQRIVNVYAIRDTKAGVYKAPFYMNTDDEAKRWLKHSVLNVPESLPAQFPEDIDLYHLGSMDMSTGLITAFETPLHLVKAEHLKTTSKGIELAQ